MKIYDLEVWCYGYYWAYDHSDPSGCSDTQVDCKQVAYFEVAANSVSDAMKLISDSYDELNNGWPNECIFLYYNPNPSSEEDTDDGEAEILSSYFCEPVPSVENEDMGEFIEY